MLGVSDDTIRRWAAEGVLPGADQKTVPGGSKWEIAAKAVVIHGLNGLLLPLGISVVDAADQEILIVAPGLLKQAVLNTQQGLQLLKAPRPSGTDEALHSIEQVGGEIWRYVAGTPSRVRKKT